MTIYKSEFAPVPLSGLSVTERLFQGLEHRPDAAVLIDGPSGREVTAGALIDDIRRLAGGLTERGYGKGRVTALMAPNIPEFATVFHGVAYAGGTITTVNPTYTAHELQYQLNDAGAELLVVAAPFLETAKEAAQGTAVREIVVIGTDGGATPLSALMGAPLDAQVPVDVVNDVLVLPYSSGTTGLPKGVMLTHRNLVANVDQVQAVRPVAPGEWSVAFLPFFHIYGMTVMLNLYLAAGGGIVTMPRFDLELFLTLCQKHKTPQAFCVPPVVLALAKHPMVDQFDLSALKYIFSGAAPLSASLGQAAAARLGVESGQGYGMTEMSPASHVTPRGRARPGAAGLTAPNTECRIVDPETGEDRAPGEEGELWVRGPQVMKGYLNNPEATAQTMPGEGWLRTGDLGVFDGDGYLFIRDRVKELIKVKGFQVAPAEVEAALLTHPGIADAAVIGRPDDEAGELPVAFVVRAPGASPAPEEIAAHLEDHLAHYKRPAEFCFVDAIPKSASGKILRRQLRDRAPA
jgi:acyl-CoA synthetase (AMP-forming)/AMP-acid ligase II